MKIDLFMVFDVESIGLHGEGFAVGWVVVDRTGTRLAESCEACDPSLASGSQEGRQWVAENIAPIINTCDSPRAVRDAFWMAWRGWADKGAVLVGDCAWPVETRFLQMCVEDSPQDREWKGPYPLHDLASVMLAYGGDPLVPGDRKSDELPAHHPLMDARQSARCLVEALAKHPQLIQQLFDESREAFVGNIEAVDKLGLDALKAQPILLAVQNWDISTGRARELLRCWVLGMFKPDMLPECGVELFEDKEEPRQSFELLRTWEAEAQAKAERIAKHLRAVLDVARTWQPDYATQMDRQTLRLAAEVIGEKPE